MFPVLRIDPAHWLEMHHICPYFLWPALAFKTYVSSLKNRPRPLASPIALPIGLLVIDGLTFCTCCSITHHCSIMASAMVLTSPGASWIVPFKFERKNWLDVTLEDMRPRRVGEANTVAWWRIVTYGDVWRHGDMLVCKYNAKNCKYIRLERRQM